MNCGQVPELDQESSRRDTWIVPKLILEVDARTPRNGTTLGVDAGSKRKGSMLSIEIQRFHISNKLSASLHLIFIPRHASVAAEFSLSTKKIGRLMAKL